MKTKLKLHSLGALLCAVSLPASAQNTAFTYQGRVQDNGTNFTGIGQFKFALVTSSNINQQAYAVASTSGGFVTSYIVLFGGSGYAAAPIVTISGGGGAGATATANISGGVVTNITAINAGNGGYTNPPQVTLSAPPAILSYTTFWSNDGTSSAGSEPTNAVSVSVTNGLFTVVLGDTTTANMSTIDASLFSVPSLQLRIWFNDGVNGSAALTPLQNLTPTPYSAHSVSADSLSGTLPAAQISGPIDASLLPGVTLGDENLRIIRGTVGVDASVIRGSGFSVSGGQSGHFVITFTRQFGGSPTAVASPLGFCGAIDVQVINSSQVEIQMWTLGDYAGNVFSPFHKSPGPFSFIAVGPR